MTARTQPSGGPRGGADAPSSGSRSVAGPSTSAAAAAAASSAGASAGAGQPKRVALNARVPEDLRVHAQLAARQRGLSLNSFLQAAVEAYIAQSPGGPSTGGGSARVEQVLGQVEWMLKLVVTDARMAREMLEAKTVPSDVRAARDRTAAFIRAHGRPE